MKMVVVGGASTYTPELIDGFARMHAALPVTEVVLVDPAAARLDVVGGMCQRILDQFGRPYTIRLETDLFRALHDASIVLIQLRVGGQAARGRDEHLPLDLGCIGQETTGVGGLAKALRTVPVVLEVAKAVSRYAPDAWIIDFTNPVGIVTRALLQAGHRAVGLCNVAIGMQHFFAGELGIDPDRVSTDHVGLNHLTWERAVIVDGVDRLPELIGSRSERIGERVKLPAGVIEHLASVPSYYLRYYYLHDEVLAEQRQSPSRADEVAAIEKELLDLYADPSVVSKPEALSRRGGALYSESAVQLASALLGTRPGRHVVNARNGGKLRFLPDDAVVEVPADVSQGRIELLQVDPLPAVTRGLISAVYAYEELALDAAVLGGRERVLSALMAHPLIGQWEVANTLTDRILLQNREYLAWAR